MKILYQALLKAFETENDLYDNDPENSLFRLINAEPPVYIDLYDSQPDMPDQFEGFRCPALFFDYSIDWQKKSAVRIGELSLVVHVVTDALEDTTNISGLPDACKKIDYYETVINVIEGIATEETSQLILSDERPVSTDYFNYHQITFTCTISRKITGIRKYINGIIEKIPISGTIKEKIKYVL
ncbi:hypothetical protein [Dysgonomonas sp. 520]|uniref:hypothetical protein n=1 Tax=Dysgonomonas sp. 520 TaxID=2302931 RepID=UPI0013D5CB42|nr:hypothetical protein [Dysgonomonas sp. 520]NDW10938.1 hypothetical protein [Dysgonomonas sp. 520]